MNNVPDSLVQKIIKLLSLAKSDNPAEAELAMAKAQRWATEYKLDLSTIADSAEKPDTEEIEKTEQQAIGKRVSVTEKYVAWILESHFGVKLIYHGGRHFGRKMTMVGRASDIALSQYLYAYLQDVFMKLWHKYAAQNQAPVSERSSFIYGLYRGLDEKLAASKSEIETQYFAKMEPTKVEQSKQCYALALVSHKDELNKKLHEFYPNLRSSGRSAYYNVHSNQAVAAGRAQGKMINTNRPLASSCVTPKIS